MNLPDVKHLAATGRLVVSVDARRYVAVADGRRVIGVTGSGFDNELHDGLGPGRASANEREHFDRYPAFRGADIQPDAATGGRLEIDFTERTDGTTTVVLTHRGLRDEQSPETDQEGWDRSFEDLARLVSR